MEQIHFKLERTKALGNEMTNICIRVKNIKKAFFATIFCFDTKIVNFTYIVWAAFSPYFLSPKKYLRKQ